MWRWVFLELRWEEVGVWKGENEIYITDNNKIELEQLFELREALELFFCC